MVKEIKQEEVKNINWKDMLFIILYGISFLMIYSYLLNYFENKIINIVILIGGIFLLPWSLAKIVSKIIHKPERMTKW